MHNIAILVLAAGGSTRMGSPKQLLEIEGKSLIRRTCELALDLNPSIIAAVLGNAFFAISQEIKGLPIMLVENANWEQGMASSLRTGIKALSKSTANFDAVLMLLCDQPLVNQDYLDRLVRTYRSEALPAAASAYNNILGVPVIFDWEVLRQFASEDGDHGARFLLKDLVKKNQVTSLDFPEGAIDLDTPEAYQAFISQQGENKSNR
jgi:molybdenum cofactor cytidylyltransferase